MLRLLIKRPLDTVEVLILPNKDGSGYQYINLSKGHICPCKFKTIEDAINDLKKRKEEGTVLEFLRIGNLEIREVK